MLCAGRKKECSVVVGTYFKVSCVAPHNASGVDPGQHLKRSKFLFLLDLALVKYFCVLKFRYPRQPI